MTSKYHINPSIFNVFSVFLASCMLISCDAVDNKIKEINGDNIDNSNLIELNGEIYYIDKVNSKIYKEMSNSFVDIPFYDWSEPVSLKLDESEITNRGMTVGADTTLFRNQLSYTMTIEVNKDENGVPVRDDYQTVFSDSSNSIILKLESFTNEFYEVNIPLGNGGTNLLSSDGKSYSKKYSDSVTLPLALTNQIRNEGLIFLGYTYRLPAMPEENDNQTSE